MKLNNRGFAISTIMYMILIMAIILITVTLTLLSNRKLILDKTKQEAKYTIYNILPEEYQQVEYIESTGTQYIDIGCILDTNTTIDASYSFSNNNYDRYYVFGGYVGVGSSRLQFSQGRNVYFLGYGDNYSSNIPVENIIGKTYKVHLEDGEFYVDDNLIYKFVNNVFEGSFLIYLFAVRINGNAQYFSSGLQIRDFSIYDNDTIIRDFIPCYRKSDSVIGMYDTVNGVFYTNKGTGTFLKGNDVN